MITHFAKLTTLFDATKNGKDSEKGKAPMVESTGVSAAGRFTELTDTEILELYQTVEEHGKKLDVVEDFTTNLQIKIRQKIVEEIARGCSTT